MLKLRVFDSVRKRWGWRNLDDIGGGSVKKVQFPFSFDTPGLTDGVEIYTPTPGDILLHSSTIRFKTDFNGNSGWSLYSEGDDNAVWIVNQNAASGDGNDEGEHRQRLFSMGGLYSNADQGQHMVLLDTTPLIFRVDADGLGGPTDATEGEGELILLIVKT